LTGRKGRTAVALRKGIPHKHVDLTPLVSIKTTGVCIPISKIEVQQCVSHQAMPGIMQTSLSPYALDIQVVCYWQEI
jgi:hypothetical protein